MPFKDLPEGATHYFGDGHLHLLPKIKNMTGEKYGWLTVLPEWKPPTRKGTTSLWLCQCNCGNILYVSRDHLKSGNTKSCGCYKRKIISELMKKRVGNKNPNWTGDNVSYDGVHLWIHRHKNKLIICEKCGEVKRLDAANISGEYKRNVEDFQWLCRKCHMKNDGRLKNLIKRNKYEKK